MAAPDAPGHSAGATAGTGPLAPGFAVYVHWPFCLSKCPYCDFNSHVRDGVDHARWQRALVAEVDRVADLAPGRLVTSIFFGGGTPSLMAPATAAAVIDRVAARFPIAGDVEITLEANPTSVEAGKLDAFRDAGINRVSLGVQALDDRSLKALGRGHSAAEAMAAVAVARARFARVSFDLIYARPGQSIAEWERELDQALGFAPDHLSLYQLTIERGTAFFGAEARGDFVMPSEDLQADLFAFTQARMEAAGLPAYEISNHARPGDESRHNLTYWRYGDYAGIGPGAHGRLPVNGVPHAHEAERKPEAWLAAAEAGDGTALATPLDAPTRAAELLMMGLRLAEGVPRARFAETIGAPLEDFIHAGECARMVAGGFLAADDAILRTTPAGRPLLNTILGRLLA